MSEDFYPLVDSGDAAPDNTHLAGTGDTALNRDDVDRASVGDDIDRAPVGDDIDRAPVGEERRPYAMRISVYDDMLSTPRVIVVEQADVRMYLEDVTNTVHRTMKEQGGRLPLMVIRELVENFIHAQFSEPVISILDDGDTIRFADQGPGIDDKERAFEFGVTSADRAKKRYIRGTGAGLPMVQQYIEAAGGAISVEDNLRAGTVVTVSVNPARVEEIERAAERGAAVRGSGHARTPMGTETPPWAALNASTTFPTPAGDPQGAQPPSPGMPAQQGTPAPASGPVWGYPASYPQPNPWVAAGSAGWPPHTNPYVPQGAPHIPATGLPQMSPMPSVVSAAGQAQQGAYPMAGPHPSAAQEGPAEVFPGAAPYISERGELALRYIAQVGKGGATDLTRQFGNSDATWSRELHTLTGTGLIYKRGQKYMLTEVGQRWAQQR